MFRDELARMISLLQANPELGVRVHGREIRRILIPDTKHLIFYRVRPEEKEIEVVALWSATRASGPPLPLDP